MPSGRLLAAPVLALALLAAPASAGPGGTPGSEGIGDDYYPLDGNGGIDVVSYEIHDRYRFRSGRLSGWTELSVVATQPLSSFHLDLLLPVRGVRVDGEPAAYDKPNRHELEITPRQPIAEGAPFTVRVRYDGRPGSIGWDGERNWLADDTEVVAMNQPHMAAWWFPSNDHPADKATVDIRITVPKDREVIANGRPVSRKVADDLATVRWRADEPMAPYLAFFAAGQFAVASGTSDGREWYVAVSQRYKDAERREAMALLKRSDDIVAVLEQDLGEYPFSTTGGLATALDPGFALENQTRPTYESGSLDVATVVHELAHQWFGDSVAVRRWRDIWLNEGPATFFEHRWTERRGGQSVDQWLRGAYDSIDADSSFWDREVADPGSGIDELFSAPVYYRGAMTLQALRNRIGETDFWDLLRTWVTDRADGNGSTEEFQALAEQVSGEDLGGFFQAWVRATEKPADTAANGLG